jgi:hypothetical protein
MSTRSVTQRQGLLTFDEETQNLLLYCQLYASLRFGVGIVASQNEPTHSHEILYDPDGKLPRYLQLYRSLFARAMNQRLRRTENFWAGNATSNVCHSTRSTRHPRHPTRSKAIQKKRDKYFGKWQMR